MGSGFGVLLDYAQTAVTFLAIITVLVGVHELGHFWFARMFGMHVDAFAIMMGGVRRTNLSEFVENKLVPAKVVAFIVAILAGVVAACGVFGWSQGYLVSLFLLAIPIPLWIASRLQYLYHLEGNRGFRQVFTSWIVAVTVVLFSTRFQGVQAAQLMAVLFFASLIALMLVYYQPVLNKADDSAQGEGQIFVGDEPKTVQFRPLLSRKDKHGTEYALLVLPLGGFAAIKGMHPKEDGSEVNVAQGFYSKSPFARFMVLFAGPLFSIVLGVALLASGISVRGIVSEKPVIGIVLDGKPAQTAGLKVGDKVQSIDGKPVTSWLQMVRTVHLSEGKPLAFLVDREGQPLTLSVKPVLDAEPSTVFDEKGNPTKETKRLGKIGVGPSFDPVPFGAAIAMAAATPKDFVAGLARIASKPAEAKDALGGPASVVQATHEAQSSGFGGILNMAGLLSISLGIMNLLPIPPLDGGQMVVAVVEMFRKGRRLSIEVQRTVSAIGMFLVLGLMVGVILLDVGRFVNR